MNSVAVYEKIVRPLLFSIDAERAHRLTVGLLRHASHLDLALRLLRQFPPAAQPKTVFGLTFPNPIGLAAGFNKNGADIVANRLRYWHESKRWPSIPVGINIGKSKSTPLDQAPADYLHSFRRLRKFADYVVLNVSSPNTPGLRSLQEREALTSLLRAVWEENRDGKPVLVKISPDLAVGELEEIIATCEENQIAGIIATNTTLDHSPVPAAH